LFSGLSAAIADVEKVSTSEVKVFKSLYNFIRERRYEDGEPDVQKVIDFIAGMTDSYAQKCFEEMYWF
jgi:dGTPase